MKSLREFMIKNPAECLAVLAMVIIIIFVVHTLITC